MNIKEYTNMEIDSMSKDDLLKLYVELQKAVDKISMNMQFIKSRLQALLERDKEDKYTNRFGEVSIIQQHRNQFMQSVAKELLTKEQLEKCYIPKDITFVKILSSEAKASQIF